MDMSFNLHVLKSDSCDLLTVDIYKKKDEDEDIYVELDNKKYYLNSLKVKHLRDYVCRINGVDDITQKLSGEEMKIRTLFKTHFKDELSKLERDKDYELVSSIITIIPDAGPSQQGVPQVTLPEPNEIFENFLKSEHRQFLNKFIENNDALPSYDSGMSSLKTSVPATSSGDRPSLLLHNLPGDDHKHEPITREHLDAGKQGPVTSYSVRTGALFCRIKTRERSYDDDIFRVLMLKLIACPPSSVTALIIEIYMEFDKETFIIILDEIQVLETVDKGKFRSRTNEQEERSLLSPLVQAMREPASSVSDNRYFIPCGTGLGILSLEDNYISKLVELTDHDYNYLYNYFHGRFRPIVTCVEEIIMGESVNNVVEENWNLLTKHKTSKQSLYKQLSYIIERERADHVKSINVLNLYKRVALAYFYSGSPFLFSNIDQMSIVESGFGRLRFVDPPTKSDLKKMCDDDNTLKISMWIQNQCFLHVQEKILYVDEPFAINTLFNFFENNKELSDEILEIMSIVNNPSACGLELRCVKKRNKSKKVDEKDEDMGEADEEEKMGEDMGDRERFLNEKSLVFHDKVASELCGMLQMITVKQFKNKASELPPKDSTRTGIVFGDRFLKFMGIYGDFTRFIAEEVPEKTMDEGEEESKMMIDG
ncbi:hypothetical protein GLOIN_2v1478566 [Rhizophagus irregularis DAOM 181602=DAOM 197198]|nr:hypothetical protein GLOIN_2v1478566 [Rhizophagus irregularis DAOM 181602=DAOM 197198]